MTVEELNIVISANDRKFNEAISDVIGRLDDLEEQSRRSTCLLYTSPSPRD